MRINIDTLDAGIYIFLYHFTRVTVTCIFMYSHSLILYYNRHCWFIYLDQCDMNILLHHTLLFYVFVSLLHGHSCILNTIILCTYINVTRIPCYSGRCYFIFLFHRYIGSPEFITWSSLYHCFMKIYWILISDCSCMTMTIIDMLLTWLLLPDLVGYWYSMCGPKCQIELVLHGAKCHTTYICGGATYWVRESHYGDTSKVSHLLFLVILFDDTNNTHVLISCYKLHALLLSYHVIKI